jgi:hypothetical protein
MRLRRNISSHYSEDLSLLQLAICFDVELGLFVWESEIRHPLTAVKISSAPSQDAEDVSARVSRLGVEQGLPTLHSTGIGLRLAGKAGGGAGGTHSPGAHGRNNRWQAEIFQAQFLMGLFPSLFWRAKGGGNPQENTENAEKSLGTTSDKVYYVNFRSGR